MRGNLTRSCALVFVAVVLIASAQAFFFASRRRHTRLQGDWRSDMCSSDLGKELRVAEKRKGRHPAAFRQMAVERMKHCENIVALSEELGVSLDRKSTRLNSSHL